MIVDAAYDIESGTEHSFDICVVGSGPAGVTLALALESLGFSVGLLEAGGVAYSKENQDFFRGEVTGTESTEHLHTFRYRQFGGTSSNWGGRCLLYDRIDFEHRDYIPDSGWPIDYDTMVPYYKRALERCEAGPMKFDAACALPEKTPQLIEGLPDGEVISSRLERWSPPTDFSKRYYSTLKNSPSISVMLNASCVAANLDDKHKKLVSLTVRAGDEKSFLVRAKAFVLAAGGLEVPRLLLASRHQVPCGIGNHHDLVGRYFMTHIAGMVAETHFDTDPVTLAPGYDRDAHGVYVRRRIAFSENAQRRERIPNISLQLHHSPVSDPAHRNGVLSAIFVAKQFESIRRGLPPGAGILEGGPEQEDLGLWYRHCRNLVVDMPALLSFLPRFGYLRFLQRRRIPSVVLPARQPVFPLNYHAEQSPNRESRVRLTDDRDQYGVPRMRLDFRVNESDIDGIYRAHKLLGRYLQRFGMGHVRFEHEDPLAVIRQNIHAVNGHFIGTTRMSTDPRTGVVDPDCRVHGVANLFISSSSVFPTSSHANPTLTIVAMALRLADHLKEDMPRQ